MEPDEDIKKMFDRFSVIVNGLKGYGEIIPEDKLVRKLIYSLPESWDSKKTAIIEAKNLKTLKLDELMGSLLTHELMNQGKRDEEKKKEEKKEVEKKKIGIALKVSLESDSSDEDDEEMAFLAKRFTRFMKSNRGRKFLRKGEFKNKNREEEKDQLICYECKKLGHIRTECPQLKKKSFGKKKKLKAHVATWSDEESSDEDEEEVANLCLMALDDEPKVTSNSSLCDLSYNELFETYEELQEVYDELVEKYKESILKNKKIISDLKNDKDSLYEANHNLELKIKSMQEDQKVLEKKNQDLHGLLSKVQEDHQKEVGDLKASLNKGEHCYKAKSSSANSWYLDSGCSRHMTGDKSRFLEFKSKSGGVVTFGDNSKGNIEGIGSIGKFDAKSDEAIFLGYSLNSKAYRVFNKRTLVVEESIHVVFDDNLLPRKDSCDDDDVGILQSIGGEPSSKEDEVPTKEEETQDPPLEALKDMNLEEREVAYPRELNYVKGGEILGDPSKGVTTRASLKNTCHYVAFISCIEPKNIKEALNDDFWILAMQEELNQFDRSNVWTLVDRPHDKSTIGTKWVFRNKLDESGNIVRNKARLVAQGYTQEEGIDFDETYAPVARMEAIRMLLAFACHHEFKLFQMDVKSAFLNGFINEEVYVEQPPGFEDPKFPNHVFKLSKALYGLKQAPRACKGRMASSSIKLSTSKKSSRSLAWRI
ncbi:hypothetical protein V6N11_056065 [Hibiscus sabdariffa]|uniref:CCHC-type domain-containing protein n=1 Tax=Hibiscus sabdariffa TaxID=183260 RepID=A0ABR2T3E7_9ROSI